MRARCNHGGTTVGEQDPSITRLVVVSGLSGAGKSIALNTLEDLGYYCTDNLPVALLPAFAEQMLGPAGGPYSCVAVGIDARNPAGALERFPELLADLRRRGVEVEVLFLEADDDILIKRFSETRRRHPLSADDTALGEAIRHERELLAPFTAEAGARIDTSLSNLHELRETIRRRVAHREAGTLSLQFVSFGFKHGVPRDADFVFDVRCLPNPHWDPELRALTGCDAPVAAFLERSPEVEEMAVDLTAFLVRWVPRFEADNRAYLTVAVGCTGGQHRSVYMAQRLGEHFRAARGRSVLVRHRECPAAAP